MGDVAKRTVGSAGNVPELQLPIPRIQKAIGFGDNTWVCHEQNQPWGCYAGNPFDAYEGWRRKQIEIMVRGMRRG